MNETPIAVGTPFTALRALDRWVGWRWETREGKPTKPPFAPATGRYAKTSKPSTWGSHADALAMPGMDGVGFVLAGHADLCALDLDHCRNAETGKLNAWAEELQAACGSYAEITPSGTGIRIVGVARGLDKNQFILPRGPDGEQIEIYVGGATRYITVTDASLADPPEKLADITEVVRALIVEHAAQPDPDAGGSKAKDAGTAGRPKDAQYDPTDLSSLDERLATLIRDGAPPGERSEKLYKVVVALREHGWSRARIIATVREHRAGIGERCFENGVDDCTREVDLCLRKIDDKSARENAKNSGATTASADTYNVADLRDAAFRPLQQIVGDIVVEGLTLLAARPKIGKTWLMLDAAIAVARGGECLGGIACEQGDVLVLALEDNPRRMQRRMTTLLGANAADWPRFTCAHAWPRADQGGIERIREWIASAKNPRLVVLDVLARFRRLTPNGKQQSYEADYAAVAELQKIASDTGVAIVVVHHTRKGEADDPIDAVSGTLGLAGAADAVLVIDRKPQGVRLYGRGRDTDEIDKAVIFDKATCRWSILGETADVLRSKERQDILAALADGPLPLKEIAARLGRSVSAVSNLVNNMCKRGDLWKPDRGVYTLDKAVDPNPV